MKKVSILVFEEIILSSVSGVLDLLRGANQLLVQSGKAEAFDIELVSGKVKEIPLNIPGNFHCARTVEEVEDSDLIIIPAFSGNPDEVLKSSAGVIKWIRKMNRRGTEIASVCLGSYFIAEAGLLSGRSCTSHWLAINDMRQRYPEVNIMPDRVMTDEHGIYTSGGAFISLNLILYLIEKFCDRETSIGVSKLFYIEMGKMSQSHFAIFTGQRGHEDEEILKAQNYIEQNYNLQLSMEQVAEHCNMSIRNFIRRFKSATHNTPHEYLQRVRIEAAKKALENTITPVSAVMWDAGYNDLKTFRTIFRRITGLTPLEYRKKYCRSIA